MSSDDSDRGKGENDRHQNYHHYTSHHDYELTSEDEEKYSELFKKLDVNGDGRIDVHDLSQAFKNMNLPQLPNHAKRFMEQTDQNNSGNIDFADFLRYMTEHEKNLRLLFRKIDVNQDGRIDATEILTAFHELGINIDDGEANKLLKRMDKGGSLDIDWNEWHEYLVLHPASNINDIIHYWRNAAIIDTGDGTTVLDESVAEAFSSNVWWKYLLAGGMAGAVSRTCTAPLDRLKVLMQVHATKNNRLGILSGLRALIEEGGMRGLWRGNFVNVIKITPETAIKFMMYEKVKSILASENEITLAKRFVSGSVAGALSQSAIYPIEVLKTRLALRRTGQYSGIIDCATKLYQTEGFYCFYRGYLPNLLGILPYAGIDLAIYETLKSIYSKRTNTSNPGPLVLLTCGTISSSCGQLVTYPLALVRTKLQAKANAMRLKGNYDTMTSVFTHTVKTDGVRGLYHGLLPNFMKVAPAVSISYVIYEYSRRALGVNNT